MKRFSKILAVLLILSVIPVSAALYPHCRTSIHGGYNADGLKGGQRTSMILVTSGGISAPIDISDTASDEYLEHIKEIYEQYKTNQ